MEGKVLLYCDLSRVEEFFHHAHELHKFLTDRLEAGLATRPREHLDVTIEKFRDLLDAVECQTQIVLLHEDIQYVILIDAEHTA